MDRPPPTGPSASRKKKRREDPRNGKRGQPSSGANSIEVNTHRRGDPRSGFGAQLPPFGSRRDRYRSQSPPYNAFDTSRHGSLDARSPRSPSNHSAGRNYEQFSPRDAPSGPRHGNLSPTQPSGPAQAGRGFSSRGFRGGSFSSTRSESRGGAHPPLGPASSRGHTNHSGETTPEPSAAPNHSNDVGDVKNDYPENHSVAQSRESQNEDSHADEKDKEQPQPPSQTAAPGPPASTPTGPRISFSLKATSKTPVTAPKPEISQKFSAIAPRRDPQPVDDRSNRDRDLPKDTPTGPSSSRARHESDHHGRNRAPEPREPPRGPRQPESSRGPRHPERHPEPSRGPRELEPRGPRHPEPPRGPRQPRTRKVKKIERRLKPKPRLPELMAKSESPFFRKPGNESVVGSGTYGKVFKGKHVYSGRLVALKKIRMEGEKDGFPVTAVREIKLLQSLRHDNIVALQEVMIEKDACYMVFEYLSHDLTGLLNHPSFTLDPAQRKHLAKQLFEGLDYLHTRGVLHRDIKAANILVSSDGILKLADFGLARFYTKHHRNDYTNRVITIWYRSPELLLGETQYTAAVDVWSAACVMVEIFTRHAIFPGDGTEINQLDKIYAIMGTPTKSEWPDLTRMEWFELLRPGYRKPSVFAEKYKEKVPAAAFELLASMFHYDPAKRPSAAEVLAHPYFTTEHPPPRQAVELADIQGEWHEFESKALRKEKERKERHEREARRAIQAKEAAKAERDAQMERAVQAERDAQVERDAQAERDAVPRDNERKRPVSSPEHSEPKRLHVEERPSSSDQPVEGAQQAPIVPQADPGVDGQPSEMMERDG
ncbi:serine/threonine protein kinase, CMGC, CDC2/CDK subfamily [Pestalotiopsis sp. IQ-011]